MVIYPHSKYCIQNTVNTLNHFQSPYLQNIDYWEVWFHYTKCNIYTIEHYWETVLGTHIEGHLCKSAEYVAQTALCPVKMHVIIGTR